MICMEGNIFAGFLEQQRIYKLTRMNRLLIEYVGVGLHLLWCCTLNPSIPSNCEIQIMSIYCKRYWSKAAFCCNGFIGLDPENWLCTHHTGLFDLKTNTCGSSIEKLFNQWHVRKKLYGLFMILICWTHSFPTWSSCIESTPSSSLSNSMNTSFSSATLIKGSLLVDIFCQHKKTFQRKENIGLITMSSESFHSWRSMWTMRS